MPRRRLGIGATIVGNVENRSAVTTPPVMMLMTNDFITGEVVHVDGGGRYNLLIRSPRQGLLDSLGPSI
jgi:hypothetical protein